MKFFNRVLGTCIWYYYVCAISLKQIKKETDSANMDFFKIENERPITGDYSQYVIPDDVKKDFNLTSALDHYFYSENDMYATYTVHTPSLPYWTGLDDIEVHLNTEMLIIKALSSGNSTNRIIQQNYKYSKKGISFRPSQKTYEYLRRINYGRDWEIWINLKQAVKPETVPVTEKIRFHDNSYLIKVSIQKSAIDRGNKKVPYIKLIPLYFKKPKLDKYYQDVYHLKLPSEPKYLTRSVPTSKKLYETFTVTERNSSYNRYLLESTAISPLHVEKDTMNIIKNYDPNFRRATIVNLDQYFPPHYFRPNGPLGGPGIPHDPMLRDIINNAKVPVYTGDPEFSKDFIKDHPEFKIKWRGNKDVVEKMPANLDNKLTKTQKEFYNRWAGHLFPN